MPDTPADPAPSAGAPADPRLERIAALIRNGLTNSALSQSAQAWHALETRLPGIVDAIMKEL